MLPTLPTNPATISKHQGEYMSWSHRLWNTSPPTHTHSLILFPLRKSSKPCTSYFILSICSITIMLAGRAMNTKRRKTNNTNKDETRKMVLKDKCQQYALAFRMLGDGRCECECFDGTTQRGRIRGEIQKPVFLQRMQVLFLMVGLFNGGTRVLIHRLPDYVCSTSLPLYTV